MEPTTPLIKPIEQTTTPPVSQPLPAPVVQPSPLSTSAKLVMCLLTGLLIGGGGVAVYFLLLVPPPEPVIVEKVVIQQATTTEQAKGMVPAKTYDFLTIKVLNDDGATTTLSTEEAAILEQVGSLLKNDKDYHIPHSIIVSSSSALVKVGVPKDSGGGVGFVVDLVNKKITDKFSALRSYYMDQGTLVTGNDTDGLRYYSYGATSSVKLPNSTLTGNQTYREYEGPMGSSGYQVVATTTNSITFGVFDSTKSTIEVDMAYFEKVGERMFIIR